MPRKLEGKKIHEIVDDRRGVHVQVYMARDLTFRAEFQGEVYEDTDAAKLEKTVRAAIVDSTTFTWQDCIVVDRLQPTGSSGFVRESGFVGVRLQRLHIGRRADGKLYKVRWDTKTEQYIQSAEEFHWWGGGFDPPCTTTPRKLGWQQGDRQLDYPDSYAMPYSTELWNTLVGLQDRIGDLAQTLNTLLSSADGIALLMRQAQRLTGQVLPPLLEAGEQAPGTNR